MVTRWTFPALALLLVVTSCVCCGGYGSASNETEAERTVAPAAGEEAAGSGSSGRHAWAPGSGYGDDRRDTPAAVEEWFAGLRRVPAGRVTLLVGESPAAATTGGSTPSAYGPPPSPEALAAELAAAVEEMLPLLGGDAKLETPLTVAVERDHVEQIRHTGRVGEAVAGGPADVHVVYHPADRFAHRHALALALLRRADVGGEAPPPPYLLHGAALWLAGGGDPAAVGSEPPASWYGLPWRDWLPYLAAAGVLPTVAELLAPEPPGDGSFLLWAPVAAQVVDHLEGAGLARRLADPAEVVRVAERVLAELSAGAAASAARSPAATSAPSTAPGHLPPRDPLPPFLAGVSLAMLNDPELGYQSPSVVTALGHLRRAVHADAVSLMPFAFQPAADRPAMRYLNASPGSETDAAMVHAGRRADEAGFTVLWKPQIWLRGSWPGEVAMASEADWRAWFRSYRRFVVHQAVLARWVGAEIFSVGVELGQTLEREDDWRLLIAAVRTVYDGPLTYSANWHGDFDRVPFWDEMDFLGIDAYEPLTDDPDADDPALAAGARRVVAKLEAAARAHGKPLLLTELGFAAHEAAWVAPHEEGGPLSHADQARAYRALLAALPPPSEGDWLRGVFVWKAFSNASAEAPGGHRDDRRRGADGEAVGGERADFRFLHRPAQAVIRDYYAER